LAEWIDPVVEWSRLSRQHTSLGLHGADACSR